MTGRPGTPAGSPILEMARRVLGYSPVGGLPELRRAVRHAADRDPGLECAQVAVGCGAKQVIFNAFLATLLPGNEVIVPAPYRASWSAMIRMCGGLPVVVDCPAESGFRLTPEALREATTGRTRWVVLNAPGNPSGATFSHDELAAVAEVLRRHPTVTVLSDEIYAHIRYDDREYAGLAQVAPDLRERILLVDGVSKTYAMTGWRVGWGLGPPGLVRAITAVQTQNCTQTAAVSQLAAVAALEGPQGILAERRAVYHRRRDAALAILRRSPHLDTMALDGAFYLFPRHATGDDLAVADALPEAGCATVPGSAFGAPGHLRLSFATDITTLEAGCRTVVDVLDGLGVLDEVAS